MTHSDLYKNATDPHSGLESNAYRPAFGPGNKCNPPAFDAVTKACERIKRISGDAFDSLKREHVNASNALINALFQALSLLTRNSKEKPNRFLFISQLDVFGAI